VCWLAAIQVMWGGKRGYGWVESVFCIASASQWAYIAYVGVRFRKCRNMYKSVLTVVGGVVDLGVIRLKWLVV